MGLGGEKGEGQGNMDKTGNILEQLLGEVPPPTVCGLHSLE